MNKHKGEQFTTLGFNIPNLLKYNEDGYMDFIPVKVIEVNEDRKHLKVEVAETGFKVFVPNIYRFEKRHEPQKVVVPKFVAEWIGYKKAEGYTLYGTLMEAEANPIIKEWVFKSRQEVLALAWIFGYDIEKEDEVDE